jgi:hypothetical protein
VTTTLQVLGKLSELFFVLSKGLELLCGQVLQFRVHFRVISKKYYHNFSNHTSILPRASTLLLVDVIKPDKNKIKLIKTCLFLWRIRLGKNGRDVENPSDRILDIFIVKITVRLYG